MRLLSQFLEKQGHRCILLDRESEILMVSYSFCFCFLFPLGRLSSSQTALKGFGLLGQPQTAACNMTSVLIQIIEVTYTLHIRLDKTEFYDTLSGEFVSGPDLPFDSDNSCAVEVEPGTVFVSGSFVSILVAC